MTAVLGEMGVVSVEGRDSRVVEGGVVIGEASKTVEEATEVSFEDV